MFMDVSPRKRLVTAVILVGLMLLYTFYTFGPLVWVFTMSLKTTPQIREFPYAFPASPRWSNYVEVWRQANFAQYFSNSVLVVGGAIVVLILIGSMAAYVFARFRFRGSNFLYMAIFAAILVPPQMLLIPVFSLLVKYHLLNTRLGLTLVYVTIQLPMTIFILRSFFEQIPESLAEAARIDGCSEWSTFWRIMFPITTPAISTLTIVNFIFLWNEFMFAVVLIQEEAVRTLPLGVMTFVGEVYEDLGHMAAGVVISLLPVLILYLFLSDRFIEGMRAGAVKG